MTPPDDPVDPTEAADTLRRTDLIGGFLLIGAAAAAIAIANSPWAGLYDQLLETTMEVRIGEASLEKPLLLWINEGLMAIFFLLVGLELKRELLEGELSSPSQILLPLGAAAGGVIVPIAIYAAFNYDDPLRLNGWAIPAATDIAFALAMLALLGKRVPVALRTFLLSLAVFDDLVAVVIIAVAYTDRISWGSKGLGLGVLAVLICLNRLRVTRHGVYVLFGAVMWLFVLKSGVHATLAGVALGLTIPNKLKNALGHSPLHQLEHTLRPWVAFVILPVFAFVNAGVALGGFGVASAAHPVTLGIGVGLVAGKMIGVFGATMLMSRLGAGKLLDGTRPLHYLGISALAGIGFTMSLFIGLLAFEDEPRSFEVPIRLGVLGGSAIAAVIGVLILWQSLPKKDAR